MKQFTLIIAGFYGLITIILGALGSHAFKKILSVDKLASFEVGIRYQMYHAIVLLVLGLFLSFTTPLEKWSSLCMIIGTFLFSFTIYFLAFSEYWNINLKFLGPITPIGGLFFILGWFSLIFVAIKSK